MSHYIKQNHLIRSSKGYYVNFYKNERNELIIDKYNVNGSLKQSSDVVITDIIDFSLDIDNDDKIHLITLNKQGILKYLILIKDKWNDTILTKFDLNSNKYKFLTLFFNNGKVNIFYCSCNIINMNLWRIDHILNNDNKWEKKTVTNIYTQQFLSPFYIDADNKGNIHLIYKSCVNDKQQVYHSLYNLFVGKWQTYPKKISNPEYDNSHHYLFIDSNNTLHIIWSVIKDGNMELTYNLISPNTIERNKRSIINLPISTVNATYPIIFEINGELRMLFRQNNSIKELISYDYGFSWFNDKNDNEYRYELSILRYSTNFQNEKLTLKTNMIYGYIGDSILLHSINNTNIKQEKVNTLDVRSNKSSFLDDVSPINNDSVTIKSELNENITEHNEVSLNLNNNSNNDINIMMSNLKSNTEEILENIREINLLKVDLENILSDSPINDKNNIINRDKDINLENIKDQIEGFKLDINESLTFVNSVQEKLVNYSLKLSLIELQVKSYKEILYKNKGSIIMKIINFFKKDSLSS